MLKYIFLIHFITCLIFGIGFFLSPEYITTMTAWPYLDPVAGRIIGSMFLGWGFASLFGYRATDWSEVKIIVLGDIIWGLFASVAFVWMMAVDATIPILVIGFYLSLIVIFTILFLYAYLTH
jgi:hypothetical protein